MTNSKKSYKFDKQFFYDFWQLLKPYWTSEEKWTAFAFLALNVLGTVVGVRASVALNACNKDFFDALQNFNKTALTTALLHFAAILAVLIFVYGYAFYFNGLLCIRWRRWLTKNYLNKWLSNHLHYQLQLQSNNVDNPDQRISEDLEKFPEITLMVIFMIFHASLTLISFGYILWNLSGSLTIPIGILHIVIPGYLFWGALLYGVLGTVVTGWIGKKLANLDYQQQRFNADFRFSLVRLRESSEQIAMYNGESVEKEKFSNLFSRIYHNFMSITTLRKRLTFFTSGYNTAAYMLGILMAIPLYLQKKVQLGGMMQISGAFGSVLTAFSMFINSFSMFAEWRSVVFRLTEFNKSIDITIQAQSSLAINEHDHSDIVIKNLTLSLPDSTPILNNINLTFHSGDMILLCGPSGMGKSTLLRTLAKLWPYGDGEIQMPRNKIIFFLPQKPYLPLGSLQEILVYPYKQDFNVNIINKTIQICALTKFQHRLDEVRNWSQELSLGEQQLISFARVFLHNPDVIFLDESTSALDEQTETLIYENLEKFLPHATIISIGHRSSLQRFHKKIIMLPGNDKELKFAMGT